MDVAVAWLGSVGSSAAGWILPFLFVLTVVVFFHELGHFLVARWCGVAVTTFSVGFGPEIVGFTDRRGTRWRLSLIPLGGYVKFLGDEGAASTPDREGVEAMSEHDRARSFAGQSVGARAAIVAAGPIANFLLAIAIFTAIFSLYGREIITPEVDSVVAGSPAERAGFQAGDLILTIDGEAVGSFMELQRVVTAMSDQSLAVVVQRGEEQVALQVTPERQEITDRFGNKQRVGVLGVQRGTIGAEDIVTERYSIPEAALLAVEETWFVTERTISYIVGVIAGRESADQIGGPIRVAEVSAQIATIGFVALINLAAILSISIGLINLFPIPMLDGGHLVYFAAEAARGKPLSDRVQDIGFRIGLAAVLMLMVFATWNDIIHLSSL